MNPSEKIKHIRAITSELIKEEWSILDLTLKQFGFPIADQWNGDKDSYVIEMMSSADDNLLLDLAKHLGVASQLESEDEPEFWAGNETRIFLSHLASMKIEVSALRDELEAYGIKAFVAHEDIEPTREWQSEIESALSTMDGLICLLAPGFKESNWCDQEVGVAIGRQLPIITVRLGLDPYGFIGKYQALQGMNKNPNILARELYNIFIESSIVGPKITGALVKMLTDSGSFDESKRLINLIESSNYLTSKHALVLKDAVSKNSQISDSWGVPEKISKLVDKLNS